MKVITGGTATAEPGYNFDFSGASTLHIHSCAPVVGEQDNAFWRRLDKTLESTVS